MRAAGLSVDWSSALRAHTVPDQCAFRSLPYPENLSPYRQNSVFTPLLEAKTERYATNASRVTSQNPFAWASHSTLVSFQNT